MPKSNAGLSESKRASVVTDNLRDAARRALAEAAARKAAPQPRPPEIDGRDGPDPVRYGDWEVKGLASDF